MNRNLKNQHQDDHWNDKSHHDEMSLRSSADDHSSTGDEHSELYELRESTPSLLSTSTSDNYSQREENWEGRRERQPQQQGINNNNNKNELKKNNKQEQRDSVYSPPSTTTTILTNTTTIASSTAILPEIDLSQDDSSSSSSSSSTSTNRSTDNLLVMLGQQHQHNKERLDESTCINIHQKYHLHNNHNNNYNHSNNSNNNNSPNYSFMRRFIHMEEEETKEYDRRSFFQKIMDTILRRRRYHGRTVYLNGFTLPHKKRYAPNIVRNQKYSILMFVPMVLFEQFKFFFNLYFLLVAVTQFIPQLKVGFLFTYVAPLIFVLSITMAKEAFDDIKRWRRDVEANSQKYQKLTSNGFITIPSSKIKVGDMIQMHTNMRVPADCILLRTTEKSGASFLRTDQLDGETDWKLRHAVPSCQKLAYDEALISPHYCPPSLDDTMDHDSSNNSNNNNSSNNSSSSSSMMPYCAVYAEPPRKEIYDFVGNFTRYSANGEIEGVESLSLENTMWANTVVASGTVIGLVIYTGNETKSVMNTSSPSSKMGKLDRELNTLSKFLFVLMIVLSLIMVALKRFQGLWFITFFRFVLLFSSIIPISLRVNLDVGKSVYSFFMMRDKVIPGTIVRNSSIPEELGRIEYLFTDKTGTLTQNEMIFKKLNMGIVSFSEDSLPLIEQYLKRAYEQRGAQQEQLLLNMSTTNSSSSTSSGISGGGGHHGSSSSSSYSSSMEDDMVRQMIEALALCHNVTPVSAELSEGGTTSISGSEKEYQASSPDEIALVKFSESVGLTLEDRTLTQMTIRNPLGRIETFEVLLIFPFTSQSKRMGIVVRSQSTGEITFYCKGADVVMTKIVKSSNWLEEECGNLALEGLRTLVFAKKVLTWDEFNQFNKRYNEAKSALQDRADKVESVRMTLEQGMDLLGVTGVEDLLQEDVQKSLVEIRNAGIKVWMLTGDKVETAICIARSTRLVSSRAPIFKLIAPNKIQAELKLFEAAADPDVPLIIDGDTLQICLDHLKDKFVAVARQAPAVICCRCAPTQKAAIVDLIKHVTKKRTAAIGDGGNDVSMIQAADVGLGIVGKEGRHASLAADFSINQFSYCTQLILWHGRNSYKRSARLSQFVIHRGLIISIIQAVFSAIYYFAAIPVFTGWLIVGYSTFYTMLPVLTIVFDEDVTRQVAFTYPELYTDLQLGRVLSFRTFLTWVWKAVYQGGIIMLLAIFLFESNFLRIQSISFTALILTELCLVVLEVHKVNILMILSEILSIGIYIGSIFLLPSYFDIPFILSLHFWWKVLVIVAASCLPIYIVKFVMRRVNPPAWRKLA